MNDSNPFVPAATYMTKYQRQAEHAHAEQAMWLGNLFSRAGERVRGLLRRTLSSKPVLVGSYARIGR
jgi:hypothetical protein